MKRLLGVILVLAALYAGYWGAGRVALGRGLDHAQAEAARQGVQIDTASRAIRGFPSRFDTTLRDLSVTLPGNAQWQTPLLQVFALAYRPTHLVGFAPGPHLFSGPSGDMRLTTEDLRASLRLRPSADLPLAMAVAETRVAQIDGVAQLGKAVMSLQPEPTAARYRAHAALTSLTLAALEPALGPQATVDSVELSALLDLSAPLDRHLATAPQLRHITLTRAQAHWGDSRAVATGDLEVSPLGLLNGTLRMQITGWQALFDAAEAVSGPTPQLASWRNMAQSFDQDGTVELAFTLSEGQIRLGLFPLGRIPALYRQ